MNIYMIVDDGAGQIIFKGTFDEMENFVLDSHPRINLESCTAYRAVEILVRPILKIEEEGPVSKGKTFGFSGASRTMSDE